MRDRRNSLFFETFPKVTVCPPRNTFTDLNYDLQMVENKTMQNNETQKELLEIAMSELHDPYYDVLMMNKEKFVEENIFFNWYHGYSELSWPFLKDNKFLHSAGMASSSGTIKTQFFGEKYDPKKIEVNQNFAYFARIYTPPAIRNNPNYILTVEIEKVMMNISGERYPDPNQYIANEISLDSYHVVVINHNGSNQYADEKVYNFPAPGESVYIESNAKFTREDVEKNKNLEFMPGFLVKWKYNQNVPDFKRDVSYWPNVEMRRYFASY